MLRKKVPYDTVLAIALMLSALRIDWTDYLSEEVLGLGTHSTFQDNILGPSVGLRETQFHNLYNSFGPIHSKSIIRDSFYYDNTAFRELDALYDGLPAINAPRTRVEVQTFLLDRSESGSHRSSSGQVVVPPQPQNPLPNNHMSSNGGGNQHQQHANEQQVPHESDSDEGFEEMETDSMALEGAVGHGHSHSVSPTPSDEMSVEDMDLIESLWRQDIDMGVCPDTYPYKADISKPGFTDELKKQGIDFWDYSIDGETGEYVPGPQQDLASVGEPPQPVLPQVPVPQTQTQPLPQPQPQPQPQPDTQLVQQESSLSLEDCLHLLETELSPDAAQTELSPSLSHQEVEQRWQDIATLQELEGSIPELVPDATFNATQEGFVAPQQHFGQGMTNGSSSLVPDISELQQPQVPSNVFAVNATTNGMVSLQNATRPPQHQQQQSLLLTPPHNDTFQNFSNLNINPLNHTANGAAAISNSNATGDYLMQTLQQQMNTANTTTPFTAANLSLADNSSSLLMDLLNSPGSPNPINPMDLNFDEQMHDVLAALADDAESLSDEEDSEGSIFNDSEEGAAGYSSSSDQDSIKGATGGYGFARGHERQYGSDSSSNSYSGQPPKMENIRHNHSYSSPSQSQMQNGNGAQNGSYNANKLGRDEKRAKQLKLPVGVEKIVNLPVDAFNDLVKKFDLNDAQMQLVRDIRRRGKNKVAAQNCRKRKIDAIMMVETVVSELRSERDKLARERDSIDKEVSEMQARYAELCEEVFSSIQDEHGGPVDPNDFMLQQLPDGTVYLIPRNGNSTTHRDREEPSM